MSMGAVSDERLLRALAEELKLPLLQIARQAELSTTKQARLDSINTIAQASLKMVDGYLLGMEGQSQGVLNLQPVSISSLLYDTAKQLEPMAQLYNCDIDIDLSGKYGPAMGNSANLITAWLMIGYSLIEASSSEHKKHRLVLAAHRSAKGLVAGLFDNQSGLTSDILKRGRALYGSARQSMPGLSSGSGARIFIADTLLRDMAVPLHVAHHQRQKGLAVTLHVSKQLQLV